MLDPQQLRAYGLRIGLDGDALSSTLSVETLLRAHTRCIPFENLDVLMGRGISLVLDDIAHKLVHRKRGGYCFEHATLFAAVLRALGHEPCFHLARVRLSAPAERVTPRTHLFLTLSSPDGQQLVDPGFGGPGPRAPLLIAEGMQQSDGEASFVFRRREGQWSLWRLGSEELCLYTFEIEEAPEVDIIMGNHYCATHPASTFVHRLMAQSFSDGARHTLLDRRYARIDSGERVEREIGSQEELADCLARHFGIELDAGDEIPWPPSQH